MKQNRRDLLKYFGIGTVIIPVIGGTPETEKPATLIEVPKVEIAEALPAVTGEDLDLRRVRSARLTLGLSDGTSRVLEFFPTFGNGPRSIPAGRDLNIQVNISLDGPGSPAFLIDLGAIRSMSGRLL